MLAAPDGAKDQSTTVANIANPPEQNTIPAHPVARDLADYLRALVKFAGVGRLADGLALMVGSAVVEGIGLALLVPLLQSLDAGQRAALPMPIIGQLVLPLSAWLALFVGLVIVRALLERRRDVRVTELQLGFVEHLRNELHAAIAHAEWRFLATTANAEFMQTLVSDLGRIDWGTYKLMSLMVSGFLALAGVIVAFALSPTMTMTTLALGGGLWWLLRRQLGRAHQLGKQLSESGQAFFATAMDFLDGLKLIKSAGAEAGHLAEFAGRTRRLSELEAAFVRSQSTARAVATVGSAVLVAGLLLFAVHRLHLPTAQLLVILLIFARLLPLGSQLHGQMQTLLHMLPAHAATQHWLQRCRAAAEPQPQATEPPPSFERELRLVDVAYRHSPGLPEVLHDIALLIPAHRTTALVGPSGAGKTTLADLILGLNAATSGVVMADGADLSGGRRIAWRRHTAYVPQDAYLFTGSLRDNLLWARPDATETQLWAVLEQAAAADFVRALPAGLDSFVGARGARLSGGERQRIALARALLRQPKLLVLDEATSQLDSENERLIQAALAKLHGQLTIVVIAHRLATVRHADNIVVMENGRIVEMGDWQDLVEQGGRFGDFIQASLEVTPGNQERT